jgi:diguanylate cyclase (GGDEF)-like protein
MRLIYQWSLIVLLVVAFAISGGILTQRFLIWPNAKMLNDRLDRNELEQVFLGFDVLRSQLMLLAMDYAYWDATYEYIKNQNISYLADNVPLEMFAHNQIHFIVFKSKDGKFENIIMVTPDYDEYLTAPILSVDEFSAVLPDPNKAGPNAPLENSGYMQTSVGPVIFAAATILPNDLNGESVGTVLFGRLMDNDARDDVENIVKKKFDIQSINFQTSLKKIATAERDGNNQVIADLADVKNQPLIRIYMSLQPYVLAKWWSLSSTVMLLLFLFGTFICVFLMHRSLVVPIKKISSYLISVRKTGDYAARMDVYGRNELGTLVQECNNLLENIDLQHHRLEEHASSMRQLSITDALTRLSNRRHFDEALDIALAHAQRHKAPLTLLLCDVDHFKLYNDTYGHQDGDRVLQVVAKCLSRALHRKTDIAARYGGEEFAILMPDTDEKGALHVAASVQKLLSDERVPHVASKTDEFVTISIGLACVHDAYSFSPEQLIRQADEALYQAKNNGRNRCEIVVRN